ncbi:hypothetical protein B0T19DRAFT_357870 [Cercophora scortea]|uniref:Cell surface protein n=1 Tax=Cercophora scortea TaxID=314031 RepID=A0AAE0INQ9_9PEZI|nr:hypothetical protein B0T19DRAFT_357870 [Cercophora scortea]
MSGFVNKVKDALHSDKSQSSVPEGTAGPHSSRAANAADPRVDSDLDSSRRTAGHGEYGSAFGGNQGSSTFGNTGNTFGSTGTHNTHNTHTTGTSEGVHGPHSSRIANAADPRVDSDRDGSRTVGNTGHSIGNTLGSTGNTYGTSGTTGGVHNSHAANVLDPRVDSNRDNQRTAGHGEYGSGFGGNQGNAFGSTGTHNTGTAEGVHGPHSSRIANAADPRVDSDRDGSRTVGNTASTGAYGASGPGPAPHTAGPHKSDLMNKADPRVDSDLDGSKTYGGNKTFQNNTQTGVNHHHKDPTDAAQVPPSVLQEHIGRPVVEDEQDFHHRARRNSVKTNQETFSGI